MGNAPTSPGLGRGVGKIQLHVGRQKQTNNKTTNHPQHSVPRHLPPQQRAPLWYHRVSDLGKGQSLLTEKLKVRLRLGTLTDWEIVPEFSLLGLREDISSVVISESVVQTLGTWEYLH